MVSVPEVMKATCSQGPGVHDNEQEIHWIHMVMEVKQWKQ